MPKRFLQNPGWTAEPQWTVEKTLKGTNFGAQGLKKESRPSWKVHRPTPINPKCAFLKDRSSPVFFYPSKSRSWRRGRGAHAPLSPCSGRLELQIAPQGFLFWCTTLKPPLGGAITGYHGGVTQRDAAICSRKRGGGCLQRRLPARHIRRVFTGESILHLMNNGVFFFLLKTLKDRILRLILQFHCS